MKESVGNFSVINFFRCYWKQILGVFLVFQVCIYFIINSVFGVFACTLANYGVAYWCIFYLPKFVPLLLFGVYLLSIKSRFRDWLNVLSNIGLFGEILFFAGALFSFLLAGAPLTFPNVLFSVGPYVWSWAGLLTWLAVFNVAFLLSYRRVKDYLFGLVFSVLVLSVGGMLYEIPVHMKLCLGYYIDYSYPLFLGTEFVSVVFLGIILYMSKWKPTKTFFLAFLVYLIHVVAWLQLRDFVANSAGGVIEVLGWWLPRIVGASLLLSLVSGMKGLET